MSARVPDLQAVRQQGARIAASIASIRASIVAAE